MAELTITAARKLLGLPARKAFTEEALQQGWRTAAKAAHPDAGGSDAAMARLNAARDLLQPLAQMLQPATAAAAPAGDDSISTITLTISPDGHLFGPGDLLLGNCKTVAGAIAFCGQTGWAYSLGKELSAAQRLALTGGQVDG